MKSSYRLHARECYPQSLLDHGNPSAISKADRPARIRCHTLMLLRNEIG